jgi:hypothetical protein
MPLTQDEKEKLADRVVAVLRAEDPRRAMAALSRAVEAGQEGEDGMNSAVLAIATALLKHGVG